MTTQEAIKALEVFGDKCVGAGLFKSVGDVLIYKEAVETVIRVLNDQQEQLSTLTKLARAELRNDEKTIGSLQTK